MLLIASMLSLITFVFYSKNTKILILYLLKDNHDIKNQTYLYYSGPVKHVIKLYSDSTFVRQDYTYFLKNIYLGKYFLKRNKIHLKFNMDHLPINEDTIGEFNNNKIIINFIMTYGNNDYTVSKSQMGNTVDSSVFNRKDTIPREYYLTD